MRCKRCQREFNQKHFNQRCCGDECRIALRRDAKARYKQSAKGAATERRWRLNPAKKRIDEKYRTSPKGRRTAVARISRLIREVPYYRMRRRLAQRADYRRLREELIQEEQACARCGGTDRLTLDHVIPLSRGGEHSRRNVQLLCRSCNSKKQQAVERYRNREAS